MLKLKPDHISPTDEEDAAIHAAALSDPDNPPLTDADFARMRPAREVLPPALYAALTDKSKPPVIRLVTDAEDAVRVEALRRRGLLPPLENPKEQINLRLSAQVLAAFRATGKGWQARIDEVLSEAVAAGKV